MRTTFAVALSALYFCSLYICVVVTTTCEFATTCGRHAHTIVASQLEAYNTIAVVAITTLVVGAFITIFYGYDNHS